MKTNNIFSVGSAVFALALIVLVTKPINAKTSSFKNIDKHFSFGVNQSLAIQKREIFVASSIAILDHSLEAKVGLSSGFLIGKDHTTPEVGPEILKRTAGMPSDVVQGLGKTFGLQYQYSFLKNKKSSYYNAVGYTHQHFHNIRNPKDLLFDDHGLSVDQFNASTNTVSIGLGCKLKVSELYSVNLALNWDANFVDYLALGYQFGTANSHGMKFYPVKIPFQNQSLRNMISLRVSIEI